MKRNSGSIQHRLQMGFALGGTVFMLLLASGLYGLLQHHVRAAAVARVVRQAERLRRDLAVQPLEHWGTSLESVDMGWSIVDAQGLPQWRSALALNWPEGLAWGAPLQAPSTQWRGDRLFTCVSLPCTFPQGQGMLHVALDHSEDAVLLRTLRWVLVAAVLSAALLGGLFGRFLARRSLSPLRSLARHTGSIDYRRLDVRLAESDFPSEFGPLVKTLNASLSRLQSAFDRLARLGGELAHELRTPLQNLRMGLEELVLRPRDAEATRDGIGASLEEVARLAALIEQVLLLARSEHPGAAISPRALDLSALLAAIAEPFQLSAEEKGVDIRVQVSHGLKLTADEGLVRRASNNLLSNALRHAPEGGWVVVGAFATPQDVRIWVEDNGPGLAEEWLQKVGTPFMRGPRPEGSSASSFGLGLAIVKGIMNLHGGQMVLESTLGHGTKVSLSFPKGE